MPIKTTTLKMWLVAMSLVCSSSMTALAQNADDITDFDEAVTSAPIQRIVQVLFATGIQSIVPKANTPQMRCTKAILTSQAFSNEILESGSGYLSEKDQSAVTQLAQFLQTKSGAAMMQDIEQLNLRSSQRVMSKTTLSNQAVGILRKYFKRPDHTEVKGFMALFTAIESSDLNGIKRDHFD